MSKLTEGTKVVVVKDGELVQGTVKSVYDVIGMAIVDFGESMCEKVQIDKIAIADASTEKDETPTPVEKSEITITRDEFDEKCLKIAIALGRSEDPVIGLTYSLAYAKLRKVLFKDEDPEK